MNFYKRTSTGRYSVEEQMILQAIEKKVKELNISLDDLPFCNDFNELVSLSQSLDEYTPDNTQSIETPIELEENQSNQEQVITQNNLIKDEVIENEELILEEQNTINNFKSEEQFTETKSNSETNTSKAPLNFDYEPFAEPIIERSYSGSSDLNELNDETLEQSDELKLEEEKTTTLSDLPPATKRRAAEQTANTILRAYKQFAPMPFKWMAKFPEEKIEKMAFNGEIDLSIEVSQGLTFDDYVKQTNEQLEEIFEVDDDTLKDIREPLIDVLLEQELELTPTQRLTTAVLSHLAQMFSVALKLRQQNNRILSYQKHMTFLYKGNVV